jgi:hypothetical protein
MLANINKAGHVFGGKEHRTDEHGFLKFYRGIQKLIRSRGNRSVAQAGSRLKPAGMLVSGKTRRMSPFNGLS